MQGIHGEPLQQPDLDRLFVVAVQHARALAQDVDRASARAACAQDIGVEDRARGAGKIAAGDFLDKPWHVNVRRAGAGAGCIEAKKASVGFGQRSLPVKRRMEIAKPRGSFWMDPCLLHKRHLGDTLYLLTSGEP